MFVVLGAYASTPAVGREIPQRRRLARRALHFVPSLSPSPRTFCHGNTACDCL
jgi:hypothetical protein